MPGESQQTPTSRPDPSVMTTEQLDRAIKAERDYSEARRQILEQRLDDIDRATVVLNDIVTRVPTDVQREVGHLRELMDQQFVSVQMQFGDRDTHAEQQSRENTTRVDAALAAQKEASAATAAAIKETIDKLERTFESRLSSLGDKIEDVKTATTENRQAVASVVDRQSATRQVTTDKRDASGFAVAAVGLGLSLLIGLGGFVTWLIASSPEPSPVVVPIEVPQPEEQP